MSIIAWHCIRHYDAHLINTVQVRLPLKFLFFRIEGIGPTY